MAYICMSAQNAARPAHGEQPACSPWTLMRVRPPPSVRISRAAAAVTEWLTVIYRYFGGNPDEGSDFISKGFVASAIFILYTRKLI